MKTTRMLALLLALLLAFSLASFPALAAEGDVINGEVDIGISNFDNSSYEVTVGGEAVNFRDAGNGNLEPFDPGNDPNYNPPPITITAATADSPSTVIVDAGVNNPDAVGVKVLDYAQGDFDVTVNGSVSGSVELKTKTYSENEAASNTVTVEGDVTATGDNGHGIDVASSGKNAQAAVVVEGSVTASGANSTGVDAATLYQTHLPGGNTTVTVEKDVTATAVGVRASDSDNGEINVAVGGNVTGDTGVLIGNGGGGPISVVVVDLAGDGTPTGISTDLGEDGEATHEVNAVSTGIDVADASAKTSVTIDGVLSVEQGGTPIVLGDSVSETNAGNVNITVWKIEGQTGDTIVTGGGEGAAQAVQENINYIIKIAPDETSRTVFSGYKGGETLNQGEQPIAVNVPAGFTLKAAYATDGTAVPITKGADGKYYAVIPAGGGIYLSATLDKAAAASSGAAIEVDYYGYGGVTAKTMAAKQPAVKKQGPVTITFDPAGGRWGDSGESVVMKGPCTVEYTLPEAPNREGFRFVRWQCDDEDVAVGAPGERFTPGFGGSFRFTAVWEKV